MVRTRFGVAIAISVVISVCAGSGGCVADRECERSQEYCREGYAHECHETTTGKKTMSRWLIVPCLSDQHCQTDADGAFCTLTEETDQRCGDGNFCDGEFSVECRSGYPVARSICSKCSAAGVCYGGRNDSCSDAACASSVLSCVDSRCVGPACSCPEGTLCPACEVAGEYTEFQWVCVNQLCQLRDFR